MVDCGKEMAVTLQDSSLCSMSTAENMSQTSSICSLVPGDESSQTSTADALSTGSVSSEIAKPKISSWAEVVR